MGRLDDIIERNRKPPRRAERIELGLRSLFLLVILALLLFTTWALPPKEEAKPAAQPAVKHRSGHGVYLVPSKPSR